MNIVIKTDIKNSQSDPRVQAHLGRLLLTKSPVNFIYLYIYGLYMICDDLSLYYEVKGTQGPYILMLHGVLSSRVQWQANIDALSVFGRPVVVELFGHGRSPTPDKAASYRPEAYCSEFERIRKEIGADKWFVVGNSLGGALTLRYSLTYPQRIIAQAFTNSSSALADQNMSKKMECLADKVSKEGIQAFRTLPFKAWLIQFCTQP